MASLTASNTSACDEWTDIADATSQRSNADAMMTDVQTPTTDMDHLTFLTGAGLSHDDAVAICDALGATSLEDLSLVDESMAKDAAAAARLKPIACKRLQMALEKARTKPAKLFALTNAKDCTSDTERDSAGTFFSEAVVVCVDRSGSMGSPFNEIKSWGDNAGKTLDRRSRMDAVKQVFYAFRDRTESIGPAIQHQLGLIQFDDEITPMLQLTEQLNAFEDVLDDMKHRGRTAIYSSIVEAVRMLTPISASSPRTDLRVLVLSDGLSNAGTPPREALAAALAIGAVVDAIIVGDSPDANLLKIVEATGGECYQINSLADGFELMEAQGLVSLRSRRGDADKPAPQPALSSQELDQLFAGQTAPAVQVKSSNYAASTDASAPLQAKKVVTPAKLKAMAGGVKGGPVMRRIMKELHSMEQDKDASGGADGCYLFPDSENPLLMKALIEGPAGTPFEGGTFVLNVVLPEDYPFKPPKIVFETPVFHCNINDNGGICLDVLKDNWSPALSIPRILHSVRNLLSDPNTDDALRQWIAELTLANRQHGDQDTRYLDSAKALTAQHASKTAAEWMAEWGCSA